MCGIAGIVDLAGPTEVAPRRLKAMTDAIAHRGPDGEGAWFAPGVGFGHRRLAIIDPEGGHQPLTTADIAVTYNGMIYNFRELRAELEAMGARFETDCDTEVLLHGWRAWGESLPERLDGFFAAAIWDARDEILMLIRDRWGKKPLFYSISSRGEVLFGSDIDAVVAGMDSAPDIRQDALADYLAFGYVPEPKSILEGIEKLPPAHRLLLRRGSWDAKPERYWTIHIAPEDRGQSLDDAAAELGPLLETAVEKRLIADVPLGAFLSGGVDSGAMVALAAGLRGPGLDACTMAFEDPIYDESDLAAKVAAQYQANHHIETLHPDSMADLGPLDMAYGEPFADASALPTMQLCTLAAKHVKVAISGDGGDELFAGYRRYPHHVTEERLKARIPGVVARGLFGPLAQAYPALPSAPKFLRAKSTFEALATDAMGGLFRATAIMSETQRDELLRGGMDNYSSADLLRNHAAEANTDDPLARAQYVDLMTWLPGRMLVKVDRASMKAGVEVRNPLLDLQLAEWAGKLPTRLKLNGYSGKRVLKTALNGLVPSEILNAKKRGFVVPINDWMRERFVGRMETLSSRSYLADSGLIEPKAVERLWEATRDGKSDRSRELWALLMLDGFLAKLDGTAVQQNAA